MSLGIAFKGPEGVVLAADSRVTIFNQVVGQGPMAGKTLVVPATFDNATKLLKVNGQEFVGAVTYGVGAIATSTGPRTAHSFLPEFEAELAKEKRLSVEDFAKKLSDFFTRQWKAMTPAPPAGEDMVFIIGGYDPDPKQAYGRVFEVKVPSAPTPKETIPVGVFGASWGGQREIVDRIMQGFDYRVVALASDFLKIPAAGRDDAALEAHLKSQVTIKVPLAFLPLQDSVDLAIFLIRATIAVQKWGMDLRGVGGAVDVATITRTEGFKAIQQKYVIGDAADRRGARL